MPNIISASVFVNVDFHIKEAKALLGKIDEHQAELGGHIFAIKKGTPNTWEAIVKAELGISRSRAFELMAIASGKKTPEQIRAQTKARQDRYLDAVRYNGQPSTDAKTFTEDQAAALVAKAVAKAVADVEAKHERQLDAYKAELAALQDSKALKTENSKFVVALEKTREAAAVIVSFSQHPEQHRVDIVSKAHAIVAWAEALIGPASVAARKYRGKLDKTAWDIAGMRAPTEAVH